MKISAKTEYACIAMMDLAEKHEQNEPVRIRQIADEHKIPQRFLVQILLQLKGAGLVTSTRGASGGYKLAKTPAQITLGEVVQVFEGPQDEHASETCSSESQTVQTLLSVWNELNEVQQAMLQEITLADLVERSRDASNASMYYI